MLIVLASSFIFRIWLISAIFPTGNPVLVRTLAGGERGIRTLGTVAHTTVFETVPFDRSGISPKRSSLKDCKSNHKLKD